MTQLFRFTFLSLTLATGAATMTGCGGSGGRPPIATGIRRFEGIYKGTFSGVVSPGIPGAGSPIKGTFSAVFDDKGNVKGTLTQAGKGTFPLKGTVTSDGLIEAAATLPNGYVNTLTGNLIISQGVYVLSGSFETKAGDVTVVTGTLSS